MTTSSRTKPRTRSTSRGIWRWIRFLNRHNAGVFTHQIGPGQLVLVLTTIGRRTGQPHPTPLQYEVDGDLIYVASARGQQADWYQNLLVTPKVQVQIRGWTFEACAEAITDPCRVADFLALRMQRHPFMIRMLMRAEGLSWRHSRAELEAFASRKALVALHPFGDQDSL